MRARVSRLASHTPSTPNERHAEAGQERHPPPGHARPPIAEPTTSPSHVIRESAVDHGWIEVSTASLMRPEHRREQPVGALVVDDPVLDVVERPSTPTTHRSGNPGVEQQADHDHDDDPGQRPDDAIAARPGLRAVGTTGVRRGASAAEDRGRRGATATSRRSSTSAAITAPRSIIPTCVPRPRRAADGPTRRTGRDQLLHDGPRARRRPRSPAVAGRAGA